MNTRSRLGRLMLVGLAAGLLIAFAPVFPLWFALVAWVGTYASILMISHGIRLGIAAHRHDAAAHAVGQAHAAR